MATTSPLRIDDELYAAAKEVGAVMSRSASQQVTHWARIGKELEAADISHRDIARVLAGELPYDDLGVREQAIVRAEWSTDIEARRAGLNLARDFQDRGVGFAELDEDGRVVVRPDRP